MKKLFFVFAMTAVSISAFAQKDKSAKKDPWSSDELWNPIPINRQLSHDKIDRLQKQIDEFDGKINKDINLIGDDNGSEIISDAIIRRVDRLQIILENLPIDHWTKVKYFLLLEEDVKQCYNDIIANTADANYYKDLIYNFEVIFKKQLEGESILSHINENFTRSLFGSMHMYKDDKACIAAAYNGMVKMYPEEMMKRFNEYAYMDAATTMMAYLVKKNPSLILTYATSTAQERNAVRKSKDPLVMKIVEIADKAKTPLKAIVYLDQLNNGSMTIAQVNAVTEDNASYYKSLVQLRLNDNPMSKKVIERESKLQALEYVRTMNELHEAQDPVRFKCIEPLTAKEIYFLLVMCSDEIYTSTFVGSFNRMLPKMGATKGDVFLQEMNMDKFRTFIRMSAGYNKLDEFLATMDEPSKNNLMASFVHNIDKNPETDVADAVDVADAFGSIKDENLLYYLLEELKKDYERTYQDNNKRGLITYFLLNTLCTSILSPEETNDDLQAQLKVPPISFVTDKSLLDAKGRVIMQTYFYGDDDGKQSYGSFMTNFKADEWKIEKNAQWTTITSTKGSPVTVYANMPLQEPQDEEAQNALNDYLKKNNVSPSILVHRGHSYHLATTLKNITPQNKIIVLGSCGGYHNLSSILTKSEDAHIISSKQTGTMLVNDPIVRALNNRLTQSKDINWIDLWDDVGKQMNTPALQDKFNDYVPPHKNMGALFLKAFKIQMKENGLL
jgi:hypothetical protein